MKCTVASPFSHHVGAHPSVRGCAVARWKEISPMTMPLLINHLLKAICVLAVVPVLTFATPAVATGLAFAFSDSQSCPDCVVQLQLMTDTGPRTLTTFARGNIGSDGNPVGNTNGSSYMVGFCSPPECLRSLELRNWFAFILSGGGYSTITSATLLISVPAQSGPLGSIYLPQGSASFVVKRVLPGDEGAFLGGGTMAQFEQIETGTVLGSRTMVPQDQGTVISIPLTASAAAYLTGVHQGYDPIAREALAVVAGMLLLPVPNIPTLSTFVLVALALGIALVGAVKLRSTTAAT